MSDKVRVGALDALIVGTPLWTVVGPVSAGDREAIVSALRALSDDDLQSRLGLIPNAGSRRWERDHEHLSSAVVDLPASVPLMGSREDLINSVIGTTPRFPLAIMVRGDSVLCYFDHGLGDAALLIDTIAAVSRSTPSDEPYAPDLAPNTRYPLALALSTTLRASPLQFVVDGAVAASEVVVRLARRLFEPTAPSAPAVNDATLPDASFRTVFVEGERDYLIRVRKYIQSNGMQMSASAVTAFAICRALADQDIEVAPDVEVLVDLRRFLPRGRATYANLAGVVRIKHDSCATLQDFAPGFTRNTRSTRPLVSLSGHLLLVLLKNLTRRKAAQNAWTPQPARSGDPAKVTVSDITKVPLSRILKWSDSAPPQALVATPPASSAHISILLSSPIDGQVQATAAFFPSMFDPEKVRRALTQALQIPTEWDCDDVGGHVRP